MIEIKETGKALSIKRDGVEYSSTGRFVAYTNRLADGTEVLTIKGIDSEKTIIVTNVADIKVNGAAHPTFAKVVEALSQLNSFERAVAGGGSVSPAFGDWVIKVKASTTPIEITEAQADDLCSLLGSTASSVRLFAQSKLSGRVVLKKVKKLMADASYMFYNSEIETLEFPELTEMGGAANFSFGAINCNKLKEISFPKLSKYSVGRIWSAFSDCSLLTKATVHSAFIEVQAGNSVGALCSADNITDLTITTKITAGSELRQQKNLSSASVLHVLQQLNTATTGKYIQFGDIKIAATDPLKAQIQAAIDARTNWTITGITLL